jgi:hypothetical protein
MRQAIKVSFFNGGSEDTYVDTYPTLCPWCHHAIGPILKGAFRHGEDAQLVFWCTHCKRIFIGHYKNEVVNKHWTLVFKKTEAGEPIAKTYSEEIRNLSSKFVEIMTEADRAESYGLNQLIGMGYRKALEYLIKDYLIYRKPDDKDKIISKFLGNCIKDHLDNVNIKDMAERAVWLGNDETHYQRIWDDRDITDLKKLIAITVHWIEYELLTDSYRGKMPSKK